MTIGQVAYEAYCNKTGWKSLATGADLPRWDKLHIEIQHAWEAAAEALMQVFGRCAKMLAFSMQHLRQMKMTPDTSSVLILVGGPEDG